MPLSGGVFFSEVTPNKGEYGEALNNDHIDEEWTLEHYSNDVSLTFPVDFALANAAKV